MSNKIIKLSDYNLPSVESMLEDENRAFTRSMIDLKWRHSVYSSAIKGIYEVTKESGLTVNGVNLETELYFKMPLESVLSSLCNFGMPIAEVDIENDDRVYMVLAAAREEDVDSLFEKIKTGDSIRYGLWLIRIDEKQGVIEAKNPSGWIELSDVNLDNAQEDDPDYYTQNRKGFFKIATEHQCKILGAGTDVEQSFLECLLVEKGPITDAEYESIKEKYLPLINIAKEDTFFIMNGEKVLLRSGIHSGFAIGYENDEYVVYQYITVEDLAILGVVDTDTPEYDSFFDEEYIRKVGTTKNTDVISNYFTEDEEYYEVVIPVSVNRSVFICEINEESTYADFVEQVNDNLVSWGRKGQAITEEEMANLKPFRRWIKKYF